ncbi:MAG TPA: putative Fe-S cluster assembly protein SufT [Candidatus Angelobacter sp.]|nr:putative Fe-S cluster assembly protein SufT [Candidatus Angelobacter sp.]
MKTGEDVVVSRDLLGMQIPSGIPHPIAAGTHVRLTQALGGSYTVMTDQGYLLRIDAKDADAIGIAHEEVAAAGPQDFNEKLVWDQLRTIYDPEIPVNVVDLGLIYECQIHPVPEGNQIDIKMTMTAPGCGMADVLKADVQRRLSALPTVSAVNVEVVFEPQWHPARMSEGARLQLGLDLDSTPFQMYGN